MLFLFLYSTVFTGRTILLNQKNRITFWIVEYLRFVAHYFGHVPLLSVFYHLKKGPRGILFSLLLCGVDIVAVVWTQG